MARVVQDSGPVTSKRLLVVAALIALSSACGSQRPILERPRDEDIVAAVRPDLPPPPPREEPPPNEAPATQGPRDPMRGLASSSSAPEPEGVVDVDGARELRRLEESAEPVPVAPTLRAMGTVSFDRIAVGSGEGDFDPQDLGRVLRERETFFRDCFDRTSEAQLDLAARVSSRFTIDDAGGVDGVSASPSAARLERSAVCVASVIRSLRFDVPPQGGSVAVEVEVAYAPPSP